MRPLEDTLIERYPRWFGGRHGAITRPLLRRWGRRSGIEQAQAFLRESADLDGWQFVAASHGFLQLDQNYDPHALRRIPATGPSLVIANRPSGARDAMALLGLVGQVRRDVRIVANHLLSHIAPLKSLLLPVRGSLAFGVDADFADCIDGLIELDLARVSARKRQHYLGTHQQGQQHESRDLRFGCASGVYALPRGGVR